MAESAANGLSEPIRFTRYQRSPQGNLRFNNIFCLTVDDRGFLWIGTGYGLIRFDGTETKLYTPNESPHSISSTQALHFAIDQQNMMWIGTEFGLDRFNPETEHFSHWKQDGSARSLSGNYVRQVMVASDNRVYAGTSNGLDIISADRQSIKHFYHDTQNQNSLSHNNIRALAEDADGVI